MSDPNTGRSPMCRARVSALRRCCLLGASLAVDLCRGAGQRRMLDVPCSSGVQDVRNANYPLRV